MKCYGKVVWAGEGGHAGKGDHARECERVAEQASGREAVIPAVQLGGVAAEGAVVKLEGATLDNYQRFISTLKGSEVRAKRNGKEIQRLVLPADAPARGTFGLRDTGGAV